MKFNIDEVISLEESESEKVNRLKKTVKQNVAEIEKLILENKNLKSKLNTKIQNKEALEINFISNEKKSLNTKQIDVSYYMEYLRYAEEKSDLEIFMPNVNDNDFDDVYAGIMLSLQRKLVLTNKLLKETLNKEEIIKLKEELDKINFMMKLVLDYKEDCMEIDYTESEDNKDGLPFLVYSKTEAGNVVLLKDLKREAPESYDDFLSLFESIAKGQFKSPKILTNLPLSVTQVRHNNARITFEILDENVFLITGAFIKKVMSSKFYKNNLYNILKNSEMSKSYILNNLNTQSFIDEQEEITKEVYSLLRGEK